MQATKSKFEQLVEDINSYIHNFECHEDCDCCMNNAANLEDLKETMSSILDYQ